MAFVIKRTDQSGGYVALPVALPVARPGSPSAYTKNALRAQRFSTREEAEANRCPGNEIILDLSHLIGEVK